MDLHNLFVRLFILFVFISPASVFAQQLTIDNVEKPDFRSSGAIMEGPVVKGYYILYQNKDEETYQLQIMDAGLQKIAGINFSDSKTLWLLEAAYNNEHFAFLLYDKESETLIAKIFDAQGKELKEFKTDRI